jgi:cytochrome P450
MNALTSRDVLRPASSGLKPAITGWVMRRMPALFTALRAVWPIPRVGKLVAVTRYDDVREVFSNDSAFGVPYKPQLDVIMGGQPFFLGMADTPQYRADTAAMRRVMRPDDIVGRLAPAVEAEAEAIVAEAGGRLEVVDGLVRRVTFDVFGAYFGVSDPPDGDLRVWGTRLFEFQFVDQGAAIRAEVDEIAPALRQHLQTEIERRRASRISHDDVLGRCLEMQGRGEPGFSDDQIRTSLMGFIVGGPPQPPMVVPQALEQLLRRPAALAGAQEAARRNDDALLAGYVLEAMRFDPLAPALPRVALADCEIAAGTSRARKVAKGATVLVAFSSAMMDERRVPEPRRFNPRRLPHEYMHFGCGLHTCFGLHINQAVLPLMLKPLLKRPGLRRARGPDGRLRKRGAFADRLNVEFD